MLYWKMLFHEKTLLLGFQTLKTYLRALVGRLDSSRWHLRLFWAKVYSRDSIVAVNQTRSQKDKIFRNKKYHYTHKKLATKYIHSQV